PPPSPPPPLPPFPTPPPPPHLPLPPARVLARAHIHQVLANLDEQGYHLQMPPPEDEYIEHLPDELLRRNDPM
ncbi:YcgL domain-containing protein, partial [Pseudomonas peli]|uniref:YcgL domain-containing protein n=1 Tax=Pseudomonas peli TaxID=592361 RepID=UPI003D310B25